MIDSIQPIVLREEVTQRLRRADGQIRSKPRLMIQLLIYVASDLDEQERERKYARLSDAYYAKTTHMTGGASNSPRGDWRSKSQEYDTTADDPQLLGETKLSGWRGIVCSTRYMTYTVEDIPWSTTFIPWAHLVYTVGKMLYCGGFHLFPTVYNQCVPHGISPTVYNLCVPQSIAPTVYNSETVPHSIYFYTVEHTLYTVGYNQDIL